MPVRQAYELNRSGETSLSSSTRFVPCNFFSCLLSSNAQNVQAAPYILVCIVPVQRLSGYLSNRRVSTFKESARRALFLFLSYFRPAQRKT